MIKKSNWISFIMSIILTFIIQKCCFKYIVADKSLIIISTLLYFTCFIAIIESSYLLIKKCNVKENLEMLGISTGGVVFMLFLVIFR